MTAEEVFGGLLDKYGDNFNWHMLSFTNKTFVAQLKTEIGEQHFLYNQPIYAVAKCDSNDDVLFLSSNQNGKEIYYLAHLTYSNPSTKGFPRIDKIAGIENVKEYIEQQYILHYL